MVQPTQGEHSEQKYVTDGSHVYHWNEHLNELLARGDLTYCERPLMPPTPKLQPAVPPDEPVMYEAQDHLAGGLDDHDDARE